MKKTKMDIEPRRKEKSVALAKAYAAKIKSNEKTKKGGK